MKIMYYKKEELSKMSDHAINVAVAEKHYCPHDVCEESTDNEEDCDELEVRVTHFIFDPCSSWHDCMEVAEKHKIGLIFPLANEGKNALPNAMVFDDIRAVWISRRHQNPRRAILEAFLIMNI